MLDVNKKIMRQAAAGIAVEPAGFTILHPLRVRWNECDMHGIVFNVNYFLYYDVATYEWQRAIGQGALEQPDFITVRAECDYLLSAKFDDELSIGVRCIAVGLTSITLETAVFRKAELLNRGLLTYVHVLRGSGKAAPMSDDLIGRIAALETIAPKTKAEKTGKSSLQKLSEEV